MSSVFSSLVRPARTQRSPSSTSDPLRASESSAEKTSDVDLDLRELNVALQALTDIFPDIQPEVFREMLSSFSEESRLQVITEALLKHGHKWVRGRYRMPSEQDEQREVAHKYKYRSVEAQKDTRGVPLALADTFRSQQYKDAAKEALYHEFKGLSHSTIKAVLAEYNWSYTLSRPTLLDLSSKSWRSSITNFLMRRKTPTAKDHPLVAWLPADPKIGRVRMPFLIKTKCEELNTELYSSLIVPEVDRQQKEQVQEDFDLALKCNEEAAEAAGEMYDCECCFIPNTLQQMSTCNVEGHYICFTCIRHAINAALYDQGWARNINPEFCTLKCIAPMTDGVDDCSGCIPLDFVRRALLEEKNGADTVNKLNERLSSEALLKAQLPLIRCPFCSYAEIDDLALPGTNLFANMRLRRRPLLLVSVPLLELLCYEAARLVFSFLIGLLSVALIINCLLPAPLPVLAPVHSALRRIHLKRRGLRFQCHSPTCGRNSCLSCLAPWHDPHICYSSQLTSLRLTLERATTDAVKRICPQCNLAFVKSEGCNKLVCPCGYSMCYICRQGLANEGYHHFCQHFRERPGETCRECNKCDLYRVENEDLVIKRARERAEAEWWDQQGDGAKSGLRKEASKKAIEDCAVGVGAKVKGWCDWEKWLERGLDAVIV